jgi:hypothetical protein
MPHPATLLSAYAPSYIHDYIDKVKPEKIYVYVDVKNCLTSLYLESVCYEILNISDSQGSTDTSIFQSFLYVVSFWKKLVSSRNIGCSVFFFADIGRSELYHLRIDKGYKENRTIAALSFNDEKVKEIRDQNFHLGESICNKIPGVYFILLTNLEADFVSYYLISRKFRDQNILHIQCSSDHDLLQSLIYPNVIQVYKSKDTRVIVDQKTIFYNWCKLDKYTGKNKQNKIQKANTINPQYYVAAMSITGDAGDSVPGVKGIGPLTTLDMLSDQRIVDKLIGGPSELDDRVFSGGDFFKYDEIDLGLLSSKWQAAVRTNKETGVVNRSYKLISFEHLCRVLENPVCTEQSECIKYIDRVLSKSGYECVPSAKSLLLGTKDLPNNYLTEEICESLFLL